MLNLQSIQWSIIEWHRFALPPLLSRVNSVSKNRACKPHIAVHRVENPGWQLAQRWVDGMGSPLAGFLETRKYSFLMISQKLYDFSPFFLLISSPHWKADFLILIRLLGDGFSLLGSKK
jgi:hypothetical protein